MTQNFSFHQVDYLNALPANKQFSNGGICAVLSASWIRMMRDSKDQGPNWRKTQLELVAKGGGSVNQKVYSSAWSSAADVKTNNAFVLRLAGDSDVDEAVGPEGPGLITGSRLQSYLLNHKRAGVHFNFGFPDGHAIAFWRSGSGMGGHLYCFDPNEGEYKGSKSEMGSWFSTFMTTTYGSNFPWWYLLLCKPTAAAAPPKGGAVRVM